jgi:hypothetical protein
MDLTAHLRSTQSLVGMFIREVSPHLTVVDGQWQDSKESAGLLGFQELVALATTAPRPADVIAGTAGSAFDLRARMILATSNGPSAVLDLALVPNTTVFPGLSEDDVRVFGDAFEEARQIIEHGGTADALDRVAVVLAWCEGAYRGSWRSATEGALGQRLQDPNYGKDFAARVPEDLLSDLAAMRESGRPQLNQWLADIAAGDRFVPNPALSGRSLVRGVPDWQLGDTLIECKTIEPVTPARLRDAFLQLLGYALLDFDDANHIRELAVWLPRRGGLLTISLDMLLGGDAEVELPRLRAQFQAEFGRPYWHFDWVDDEWLPGTVHPTGGFDEYVGNGSEHEWLRNGKRHREDGPAYIFMGRAMWYLDGELTRAVELNNTQRWYRNNKLHRDDGPAVIQADRTQLWYRNGELHRVDGPAISYRNGEEHWYREGKRHRPGGPAIVRRAGTYVYRSGTLEYMGAHQGQDDGFSTGNRKAGEEWYLKGQRHRKDAPAIIAGGLEEWYLRGVLQRAVVDGDQLWYQNDRLHRDDGPAVIRRDGTQEFWRWGRRYKTEIAWERAKAREASIADQ